MNLQEEYFLRNDVAPPPIKFNTAAYLLLENKQTTVVNNRFKIFNIGFANREGDPGKFELRLYTPTYDSASKSRGIMTCDTFDETKDRCWWEDYEDVLTKYCQKTIKGKGFKPLVDKKQVLLASWDIVLYCYDSIISDMPFRYQEVIHSVLDDSLTVEDKVIELNKAVELLKTLLFSSSNAKMVLQGWAQLAEYTDPKSYGFWIAKIIGE